MGFVKLLVFGLIGLTIVYKSLAIYSRSVRRERLENRYDADPVPGMSRDDYVERGIAEYNGSLRPKLLLLVYILPAAAVAVTIYVINTN